MALRIALLLLALLALGALAALLGGEAPPASAALPLEGAAGRLPRDRDAASLRPLAEPRGGGPLAEPFAETRRAAQPELALTKAQRAVEMPVSVPLAHLADRPARRIRGQVLDAHGVPVEGAHVRLSEARHHTPLPTPYGADRTLRHETATDAGGRFELVAAGQALDLHAGHPEAGAAVVRDVLSRAQPLAIRLGGRGVLAGRVVDAEGEPLVGWTLHAVAQGVGAVAGHAVDRRVAALQGCDGFLAADAATDAAGRFRLAGLAPRPIELFASKDGGPRLPVLEAPLLPAAEDLELVLRHAELRVVLTRAGAAVDAHATVLLAQADSLGRSTGLVVRMRREEHARVFSLEPGASYLLRVTEDGATLHEELLRAAPGVARLERAVALRSPPPAPTTAPVRIERRR